MANGASLVQVGGPGVIDPDHNVAAVCSIGSVLGVSVTPLPAWAASWADAERVADEAIGTALAEFAELTEPAVARLVADHLPEGIELVVSSSMPVRDLEWFGGVAGPRPCQPRGQRHRRCRLDRAGSSVDGDTVGRPAR